MIIKSLSEKYIDSTVSLHRDSLSGTIGSQMGHTYLQNMYKSIISDKRSHVCIAAFEGTKVLGVITCTTNLKHTQDMLKKNADIKKIIIALLARKIPIAQIINRLRVEYTLNRLSHEPLCEILTFFVAKSYRQKGVGKKLIVSLINALKELPVTDLYVDTLKTNLGALSFYQKMGFKVKKEVADSVILKMTLFGGEGEI